MGSSSKKKRGKQRKAARNQNVANNNTIATTNGSGTGSNWLAETLIVQTIKEHIQRANDDATVGLINFPIPLNMQRNVLPVILDFLKRCEDETFDVVLADARTSKTSSTSEAVGGDLVSPSTWIKVLAVEDWEQMFRLEIVQNIGPLVRCMCNDTERLFFKSNKHWREGIAEFVDLIYKIVRTSCNTDDPEDKKITSALLLQHEGLLSSIVQWGFWKDHRPDIATELDAIHVDMSQYIKDMGRAATIMLIYHYEDEDDGDERLAAIGSTPIISKEVDPSCTTSSCTLSYVAFLIHYTRIEGWGEIDHFGLLRLLMGNGDCVDKEVIKELLNVGLTCTDSIKQAREVTNLSQGMVLEDLAVTSDEVDENNQSSDVRIAFAIRSGLIDMCLGFIERFGEHEHFTSQDDEDSSLLDNIEFIFVYISEVSLHQKAAKAIRSKKFDIERALARLERKNKIEKAKAGITNDMNDDENDCNRLLDMLQSILDVNGSYCCRCNKPLSRTEVKECNGCHCMVYCSRACQREDWSNGHSLTCCKSYTHATVGQYQGRYDSLVTPSGRAAVKVKEIEKNVSMIQLKLFLDHTETILNQATILGIPLCDCVVVFDLRCCPLEVEVQRCTTYFTGEELEGFEGSRSYENITCDYTSSLKCRDSNANKVSMQRFFPHEWLTKG